MNRLFKGLAAVWARRRIRHMAEWERNPVAPQERLFHSLVQRASDTSFGRDHAFNTIRSVADYQERVPLREYDGLKPYFDRCLAGQSNVVWPGFIRRFSLSGGTTSAAKRTPATREGIRSYVRGGMDILALYLHQTGDTDVLDGKAVFLGDTPCAERLPNGIQIGDSTGFLREKLPWLVDRSRIPDRAFTYMTDWNLKMKIAAEQAWRTDVRRITGNPYWIYCLIGLAMDAARAAGRKAETLADLWPNLRLYAHWGVRYEPYRPFFEGIFGKPVHVMDVYGATEGLFAIQPRRDSPELLLILDSGIFYEFVPVEDVKSVRPRRFTVADVEQGVEYAVVLNSNNGLWGYMLGDRVRFTSLRPHRIVYTGRTGEYLSPFGEHMTLEQVERGVADACAEERVEITNYHVAPWYPTEADSRLRHQWFIEFGRPPVDLVRFAESLDRALKRSSFRYREKRQSPNGIQRPEIIPLSHDVFVAALGERGRLSSQSKVPHLRNDRQFADILLNARRKG